MSWDINRVTLVGRLSNDVDLKFTPSGTAVAKFGLAVGGRQKPDGSDSVSFLNIVVWGKTAENCGNYLSKGKQVAIDGRLEQRSWTAQDGTRRSTVEVIADRIEFLGSSGQGSKGGSAPQASAGAGDKANGTSFEDSFYDNTNFDPSPVDPGFYQEGGNQQGGNSNDPNF